MAYPKRQIVKGAFGRLKCTNPALAIGKFGRGNFKQSDLTKLPKSAEIVKEAEVIKEAEIVEQKPVIQQL